MRVSQKQLAHGIGELMVAVVVVYGMYKYLFPAVFKGIKIVASL